MKIFRYVFIYKRLLLLINSFIFIEKVSTSPNGTVSPQGPIISFIDDVFIAKIGTRKILLLVKLIQTPHMLKSGKINPSFSYDQQHFQYSQSKKRHQKTFSSLLNLINLFFKKPLPIITNLKLLLFSHFTLEKALIKRSSLF